MAYAANRAKTQQEVVRLSIGALFAGVGVFADALARPGGYFSILAWAVSGLLAVVILVRTRRLAATTLSSRGTAWLLGGGLIFFCIVFGGAYLFSLRPN